MGLDQLLKHFFFWVSPKLKILEDLFRSCSSFTFNAGTRQIEDMTLVFTVHVFTLPLDEFLLFLLLALLFFPKKHPSLSCFFRSCRSVELRMFFLVCGFLIPPLFSVRHPPTGGLVAFPKPPTGPSKSSPWHHPFQGAGLQNRHARQHFCSQRFGEMFRSFFFADFFW